MSLEHVFQKLGKSLPTKDLDIGEELTFSNLWEQYLASNILQETHISYWKKINKSIKKGEPIFIKDLI